MTVFLFGQHPINLIKREQGTFNSSTSLKSTKRKWSSFAISTLRVKLYQFCARYSLTLLHVISPSLIFYRFSFRLKKHPIDVRKNHQVSQTIPTRVRYNIHNYHRGFVNRGRLLLVKRCHANVRYGTIKYMRKYTVYIYSRKISIVFYHVLNYDISTVSHISTCKEQTSTANRNSTICILFVTR